VPECPYDEQVSQEETTDDALARLAEELRGRAGEDEPNPSLHRVRALMDILGSPEAAAPCVHIAGTNGKTSTARMVESLLRASSLRTGLFTSPHLHSLTERISLDGQPVDAERLADAMAELEPFVSLVDGSAGRLSSFEVLTALAFAVFADAPVDVMVLETGMGGRWDSTNVVVPSVCAITPIGMDHQRFLGDTLAEIAGEKAGIITAPVPVLTSPQAPEAMAVLRERAEEVGAQFLVAGTDFGIRGRELAVGGQLLDLQGLDGDYNEVYIPLHGPHQAENAALALATVEAFLGGRRLEPELVREGFAMASSPGRLELLRKAPTVLGDAAHNAHGAASLAAALTESFAFSRTIGVLAILADKDVADMLAELADVFDEVVVTRNSSPRCLPAADLAELAEEFWGAERVILADDMWHALETAMELADQDPTMTAGVVVTGSVVSVGDARGLLGKSER
jgi:dihydrofolate synthase/folylpolyglutamate synthase